MPFHQPDQIKYFTFDSLEDAPVIQMAFTRQGGVSPAPWASLNMGRTVGDGDENVYQNRRLAFAAVGRDHDTLSDSWLVHGVDVLVYDSPRSPSQQGSPKADIILTDNPAVTLFMRYADCVPIMLVDPVRRALGLAHAGWKGTLLKVGQVAVEAMKARYGSRPADLLAVIGPSISAERYEVGQDVIDAALAAFKQDATDFFPSFNSRTHFDLWGSNRYVLEQAGVRRIEVSGLCSATHLEDWFSHRGEKGKTGRFGVLMALEA